MFKQLVRAVMRLADDRRHVRYDRRHDRYDRHDVRGRDGYRSHHRRRGWKDLLIDAVVRRFLKR
ncbi:MAG: hypothetical protein ACK5WM_21910 [Rhodospirillales bacterium]|jgi:hypothetical protein